MAAANRMNKLSELDRIVNDPNVLLDPARVWELLDELSGTPAHPPLSPVQTGAANPASMA
jgi:hypothetical protein